MAELAVVVVDFRALSGLKSLAAELTRLDDGLAVSRVDPVLDLAGTYSYRDHEDLADQYATRFADAEIDCVAGYCSASALASAIAARLDTPVVAVKPTTPTVDQALHDFAGFMAKLRADHSTSTIAPTLTGHELHAELNRRLSDALISWAEADAMDLDEVELLQEELLARFDGWLGFLLSASATPATDFRRTVVPGTTLDDDMVAAAAIAIRKAVIG
ncbi:hypothetical protein [Kutzneria sp. CA-103260]|uniref:hypothetical protein n=1 Tax=Kutzneria sp. CA-103260 TaxID=2802641 RepID=UPI001BA76C15|nr:hypothetical protein [Kutzneria sp. CA-103260]QUQ64642.1 hypothetical protein JJ691_23630 [Kutzneria sp. CA-103260]